MERMIRPPSTHASIALSSRLPTTVSRSVRGASPSGASKCDSGSSQGRDRVPGPGIVSRARAQPSRRPRCPSCSSSARAPRRSDPFDERDRRVDVAELEEAAQDVQLVGELVGLGAQTLGEALRALEFPQRGLEFGAVAEDRDRPDLAALDAHAVAVHEQHPLARERWGLPVLTRGDNRASSRSRTVSTSEPIAASASGMSRSRAAASFMSTTRPVVVDRDEPSRCRAASPRASRASRGSHRVRARRCAAG